MTTLIERPWPRFYGSVPANLDDPRLTLYEAVAATARRVPEAMAGSTSKSWWRNT